MFRPILYSLAFEALNEALAEGRLQEGPELGRSEAPSSPPARFDPTQLPQNSLFLGVAEDGLPVLLDLDNPLPGPILVCAERGAGKTRFLQAAATAVSQFHSAKAVQFGVVTATPEQWIAWANLEHCLGIFEVFSAEATDFLGWLREWAHGNRWRRWIVLLWDELTTVVGLDPEVQIGVRWLLLRGPTHRAWPMVSVDPYLDPQLTPWLTFFRTRLFGRIEQPQASPLAPRSAYAWLPRLQAGAQFALLEETSWLRFWLPAFDLSGRPDAGADGVQREGEAG